MLVVALDDAALLGVLSSRVHVVWGLAAGGRLGVGNDPRTQKPLLRPIPFPRLHRARSSASVTSAKPSTRTASASRPASELTITGMYNVLEKLRSGEALTDKEREIHEQGLVSVLKQIHDDLDAAVFDAYGWPATLPTRRSWSAWSPSTPSAPRRRSAASSAGSVPIPEPAGHKAATQVSLVEAGLETAEPAKAAKGKKARSSPGRRICPPASWPCAISSRSRRGDRRRGPAAVQGC